MHFKHEKLFNEIIVMQKNIINILYKLIDDEKYPQFSIEISSIFKSLYNEAKNINYLNSIIGHEILSTNVKLIYSKCILKFMSILQFLI
jgi:hypothetical protein